MFSPTYSNTAQRAAIAISDEILKAGVAATTTGSGSRAKGSGTPRSKPTTTLTCNFSTDVSLGGITIFRLASAVRRRHFNGAMSARTHAVIALQGLVPYIYEIQPALFISQSGDVSARFTGTKDLLLTQRLIVQPRLEINAAIQKVERFTTGSGLNDIEFGFRLRYEIKRQFVPYVGISFDRSFFGTAHLVRQDGGSPTQIRFVAGVRMWR